MISFIIIGKNESKNVQNCLNSVYSFVKRSDLRNYEILYVDSNSEDNTIELVLKYPEVKVYKVLLGESAASARNIGAEKASNNILFFIDGDMEVFPEFYDTAFENRKMKHPFITGHFIYHYQNDIKTHYYKKPLKITSVPLSNGTFIIEKQKWKLVGGMDERFKKAQDFDFILSAARKGVILKRLNANIAKHNTVDYNHPARLWRMLFKQTYIRSLLYRKHFFNKHLWPQFFRREYTLLSILFCIVFFAVFQVFHVFFFYAMVVFLKSLVQKNRPWNEFFLRLFYYPLRDFITVIGLFFFFPKQPKKTNYQKIK